MTKKDTKLEKEMVRLHEVIEQKNNLIFRLEKEIANLHHQATGYDAVVDFLWHKLER